jgi:hypothetical protein
MIRFQKLFNTPELPEKTIIALLALALVLLVINYYVIQ